MRIAHGEGSYPRLMNQLAKTHLLILDDWDIQKITSPQRNDLMEIIEDRYGLHATLMLLSYPSNIGMITSARPPWQMLSSTACCIMPTDYYSTENQ